MRTLAPALVLVLASCGDVNPCADVATACLAVHVESDTIDEIDQLELDLLYGELHATTTTQADGGQVIALPLALGIRLPGTDPLAVGIVAAGKLSGVVLGTGAASIVVEPDQHAAIEIRLAPIEVCVAGSFYCGGDKLAGDPDTLYQCNGGGVPLARGVCTAGCIVRPTDDDTCRADGGPCTNGGLYCGGDELDGDPQTLYTCAGGVGTSGMTCADGCVVRPGQDDACR